jgi:hypothetical protein
MKEGRQAGRQAVGNLERGSEGETIDQGKGRGRGRRNKVNLFMKEKCSSKKESDKR